MVNVTLPDGSVRPFEGPVTVAQVASSIGAGLAKAALAGKVDGKRVDTSHLIDADAQLAIGTAKDAEALDLSRHDAAHVMAQAVQELYPGTQVTIGPSIEDGFYYDFARAEPFTPEDLAAIEKRMDEIVKRDLPIVREVGRPRGLSAPPGGGREARPPPASQAARPPAHAGRGAVHGVLASHGLDRVAADRAVHAAEVRRIRLPRSAHAGGDGQEPVGEIGPLGQLPRQHVHDGVGEPRLRGQADELPGPCADLQQWSAFLPRPAAAPGRVRLLPSQRAVGRAARHHAGARLHP